MFAITISRRPSRFEGGETHMEKKPKTELSATGLIVGLPDLMVEVPYGLNAKLNEIVRLSKEGKIEEARRELEKGFRFKV